MRTPCHDSDRFSCSIRTESRDTFARHQRGQHTSRSRSSQPGRHRSLSPHATRRNWPWLPQVLLPQLRRPGRTARLALRAALPRRAWPPLALDIRGGISRYDGEEFTSYCDKMGPFRCTAFGSIYQDRQDRLSFRTTPMSIPPTSTVNFSRSYRKPASWPILSSKTKTAICDSIRAVTDSPFTIGMSLWLFHRRRAGSQTGPVYRRGRPTLYVGG